MLEPCWGCLLFATWVGAVFWLPCFFCFEHDLWHLGSFFLIFCCEDWLFFGVSGGETIEDMYVTCYIYCIFRNCGIHLQDVLKQIGGELLVQLEVCWYH